LLKSPFLVFIIFQKADDLAYQIYKITKDFEEQYANKEYDFMG